MKRLVGSACTGCDEVFWPAVASCPRCGGAALAEHVLSGKGDVYSYTVIPGWDGERKVPAPLVIAIIHLSEGAYVQSCIVDVAPDALFIGMPVEATPVSEATPANIPWSLGIVAANGDNYVFQLRRNLVE